MEIKSGTIVTLKIDDKGYSLIENTLLQLPGHSGVHEFIEDLRKQVQKQVNIELKK